MGGHFTDPGRGDKFVGREDFSVEFESGQHLRQRRNLGQTRSYFFAISDLFLLLLKSQQSNSSWKNNLFLISENKKKMVPEKQKSLHLPILIEQDEDGVFIVSCPTLRACHSYGKTVEEGLANLNLREVIEMCLEEENNTPLNQFVGFREIEFLPGLFKKVG